MIPYGQPLVDDEDVAAVVRVLRSGWLTTGALGPRFEEAVASHVGADHAVAVSSGTAALHLAAAALDLGPGDEVVMPSLTFIATANAVSLTGATPIFVDVHPGSFLMEPRAVADVLTSRTKAIMSVDYAGHPCDYEALRKIADGASLALVADATHALGATYRQTRVGSLADMTIFSFHPVKAITTGEGGMVTTGDAHLAHRVRRLRNHGFDPGQSGGEGWLYDSQEVGLNYRLSDLQSALGLSQLEKLEDWVATRRSLAGVYQRLLAPVEGVKPQAVAADVEHAYHLFVVAIDWKRFGVTRARVFEDLRERGVGAQVHYRPAHLHSVYMNRGHRDLSVTESAYEQILTLPLHPDMSSEQVGRIAEHLSELLGY